MPVLDDDVLIRFLQYHHFSHFSQDSGVIFDRFGEMSKLMHLVMLNPYNGFKLIDALQFLLLNNVLPRSGSEHPLFDQEFIAFDESPHWRSSPPEDLNQREPIMRFKKSTQKLLKSSFYLKTLHNISQHNLLQPAILMFNYPLTSSQEYRYSLNKNENASFVVEMKPLQILANMNINVAFKLGKNENNISVFQLNSLYQKFFEQQ